MLLMGGNGRRKFSLLCSLPFNVNAPVTIFSPFQNNNELARRPVAFTWWSVISANAESFFTNGAWSESYLTHWGTSSAGHCRVCSNTGQEAPPGLGFMMIWRLRDWSPMWEERWAQLMVQGAHVSHSETSQLHGKSQGSSPSGLESITMKKSW